MNNITIEIGSNPIANHYCLEHKIWIFKWRVGMSTGRITSKEFIIEFRVFGLRKKFRYEKSWGEPYLGRTEDSHYERITYR